MHFARFSFSRSWILTNDAANPLFVLDSVSLKKVVCLSLGRGLWIGIVEQILDTQEDLLHSNGRFPCLFFVEDREADGARRINVGMKQRRNKLACFLQLKSVVKRAADPF